VGTHTITAEYPGDINYPGSTSTLIQQIVASLPETIELVGGNDQSAVYGTAFAQPLTVVVTLSNGTPAVGVNVAFVGAGLSFSSNGIATTNSSGQASVTATGTHVGAVVATATTAGVGQTVSFALRVTPGQLTVTANNASRVFGAANPAFTATIAGFVNGEGPSVVSGAPNFTTTATPTSSVGIYPITPTQGTLAAANYTFAFVNGALTVTQASGSVALSVPTTPSREGGPVSLSATVPAGATGTVTFYEGTTALGTVTISGTTATLVISTLAPGSHTITAVYSGDANFSPATSPPVTLMIFAPDFTVASSTGRQLIPPGASANFTIVVSSMDGIFTNPVTMSASNLPPGATYTFSPAAVIPGATGADTTFTVSVPKQSNMASRGLRLGPVAFALLLLPFACLKRYRRRPVRLLVWMLAALVSLGAVSGCGEGGYFSQTEQTYTITVTGTSGNLVRSTTVTLTVE
jgi:hypothetical protein